MIELWDVAASKMIAKVDVGAGCIAFSPDGNTVATGAERGTIKLWNVASAKRADK